MAPKTQPIRWFWKARAGRMLIYLLVLLGVAAWKFLPRPWHPATQLEAPHHVIESTATRGQTEDTAHAMELLYAAYSNRMGSLPSFQPEHPKLKVKLFKDRAEFRWINPGLGWAEAFYRKPYCRAYFSAEEINPYSHFNLYYLHWWTLTHFIFENPRHGKNALALVQRGGGLEAFEQTIGAVDQIQPEWHSYVRHLKITPVGGGLKSGKSSRVLEGSNSPPKP